MLSCFLAWCLGLKPISILRIRKRKNTEDEQSLGPLGNTHHHAGEPVQPMSQCSHCANITEGSRIPRAVSPSSYLQCSTSRESKPSLCCYYLLFIPPEEFIQSSFAQQDPGLFFTGVKKTNRTSAGNVQARLCHPSVTQGRSTNKPCTAPKLLPQLGVHRLGSYCKYRPWGSTATGEGDDCHTGRPERSSFQKRTRASSSSAMTRVQETTG